MAGKLKKEYINDFENVIKEEGSWQNLYKQDLVKNLSTFNEFASLLLEKGAKTYLDNIKSNVERDLSYNRSGSQHKGITTTANPNSKSFRWEEREVIAMYNCQEKSTQFKLLDYQVPLKNTNSDREKGIDIVGTDGTDLFILEYKRFNSDESLLRSVLECYSYRRLVNVGIEKFAKDFGFPEASVIPSILMMKGSKQHKAFINQNANSPIIKLMEELEVKAFLIEPESVGFMEDDEIKKKLSLSKPVFNFKFNIHVIRI